ncbi:hypothetical protein OESDEN_00928 [Oesophagostomum dentatum]|uniref:Phlebovirus glycoprotein G2 fusion domain-containing protein n=1 Tax=Oesophagostomum dentatum TaxID=61180 RepID=A0A0B1TSJ5_OESDE|nr:hypothetical protein OESDEN_00928 [Oesophagostomum dentatum]
MLETSTRKRNDRQHGDTAATHRLTVQSRYLVLHTRSGYDHGVSKTMPLFWIMSVGSCAHTSQKSYIPELQNTYMFPGIERCTTSCGSIGCECLLRMPGCLFSRSYAKPLNEKIYEIFHCPSWEESAILKYIFISTKGRGRFSIFTIVAQTLKHRRKQISLWNFTHCGHPVRSGITPVPAVSAVIPYSGSQPLQTAYVGLRGRRAHTADIHCHLSRCSLVLEFFFDFFQSY